jgi:site-specific DNA-methyltransferase (adenine-specific)
MSATATALSRVVFSSAKSDWRTPQDLFDRLDRQWGKFDLDAAADDQNSLCDQFYCQEADALAHDWYAEGARRAFVNPPYGRGTVGKWVAKALEESRRGCRVVMLLPSRTDSAWFHDLVKPHAFHVEDLRGRVRFQGAKAGAPFPSLIVVFEAADTQEPPR